MIIEHGRDITALCLKSNTVVIGEIYLSPFTHIQSKDKLQSQHIAFMALSFFLGQDDVGIIIVSTNNGVLLVARCLRMLY